MRDDERILATRAAYLARARSWAKFLWAHRRVPLSVDDIRDVCPPPTNIDPRIMGHVFERGEWTAVDWGVASKHCNKRPIRRFVRKGDE